MFEYTCNFLVEVNASHRSIQQLEVLSVRPAYALAFCYLHKEVQKARVAFYFIGLFHTDLIRKW